MLKRGKEVRIFFIERKWWTACACLCLAGAVLAALLSTLVLGTPLLALGLPLLGYLGFYLLGSGLAILLMLRTGVLSVLAASE